MQSGKFRTVLIQGALGLALATGVAFVPGQAHAQKQSIGGSQLSVAIEAQADTAARDDGVDTYKVVVVNRASGTVEDIELKVPFAAGYDLTSATFSQDDAWLARGGDGAAVIRIEQMRGIGDTAVATLRFVGPRDAATNALTSRASATWDVNTEQYTITSNLPGATNVALVVAPSGPSRIAFSGGAFASNEPVNFWYTTPDGKSIALVLENGVLVQARGKRNSEDHMPKLAQFVPASAEGNVSANASTAGLPAGTYTLAARGDWSGATASASFTVK